ncbi:nibrin [Arapaima gigas]
MILNNKHIPQVSLSPPPPPRGQQANWEFLLLYSTFALFCPEIDEPSLDRRDVQLGVKPQRRTLFQGKTFVFLGAKQLKRLSAVIAFGGGRVQLLEEGSLPVALLESPKTCVVDLETASSQALQSASTAQWSVSVARILQRKGLRMITESEIGLAAIYVTTDLYCNPSAQMNPEVVPDKPGITEATLSQSNAVDETTLPAASQNATAYAPDTEVLQGTARMDTSGPTSVGETPEKEQRQTERLSKRPTGADNPSKSAAAETTSTSVFSAKNLRNEKDVIPSTVKDNIQPVSKLPPTSAAKTKSPQKQTYSLTNYFLPISKKRNREGSEVGDESEAKLFRREEQEEDMENKLGHSIPRYSSLSRRTAATADPEPSVAALAVRPSSRSVDQGLSSSSTDHRPTAAKRKEMGKEDPTDDVTFEVEMEDLEDLESIMSLPMEDADKQKEACKRRRTELAAEVKQEEASFVQDFDPVQRDKKEEDPPKNVLIVQFKSLVVDKPQRLRENPANPQMIFGKNFKRFQKVPVLGSTGLPKIIGGSDLVAHNRAKNSELEEWLREAAEEDNRTEWEETLGDDLFRYNPKPSKRR